MPTDAPSAPPAGEEEARARLVVLVSGTGSLLGALLAASADPAWGGRVVGVLSDRADAGGLRLAADAGIPTAVLAPSAHADRAAWDAAVRDAAVAWSPDWVVSAGFMRILGRSFLDRFEGRVLNAHPALLPAFPGAHAVRDALAYGAKVTGCTIHLVDAGVDTGPVVAQEPVRVEPGDDEAALHERIKAVERRLVVDVVGRVARGGLTTRGRQVELR